MKRQLGGEGWKIPRRGEGQPPGDLRPKRVEDLNPIPFKTTSGGERYQSKGGEKGES